MHSRSYLRNILCVETTSMQAASGSMRVRERNLLRDYELYCHYCYLRLINVLKAFCYGKPLLM